MNVIMKFGGTSVADAEAMTRVINIVREHIASHPGSQVPVVVVSAMSKVTDRLVETGRLAGEGHGDQAAQILNDLLARHISVATSLVPGPSLGPLVAQLTDDFTALSADVSRWAANREMTPAATDVIHAMGELASSRMVAAAFVERGVKAAWVDARQVLVTDADHTAAVPDMYATRERAQALLAPS